MLACVLAIAVALQQASDAGAGDTWSEVVEIQPCSVKSGVVSTSVSLTYSLTENFSLCENYSSHQALRVSTWSSEASDSYMYPLVFVTRQGKAVESWTIPFNPPDFSLGFDRVNRTLCCNNVTGVHNRLAYLDVFTSDDDSVSFSVVFDPVPNYTFHKDTWYSLQVGASTPQVHTFEFPSGVEAVTVQAKASSSRCAILSVQNISCPINDLLEEIKSRGHYQTMSTDGFVVVTRKQFSGNSFFIILITTNYSECHSSGYVPQSPLFVNGTVLGFDQDIDVIIRPLESAPVLPILFPLFLFGAFYVVALILINLELFLKCRWVPVCKWMFIARRRSDIESTGLVDGMKTETRTYGAVSSVRDHPVEVSSSSSQGSLELSIMEQAERDLKLPRMCKRDYNTLQSQYTVYSWNTVTVGIFYGLPAFQLVLSQQLLSNSSGEEDLCYYNFKCSHPVGVFSSFNNVWSNIGYILLGILFIIITFIRRTRYVRQKQLNGPHFVKRGIPQFFAIYYAMGLALILEGLMSSFYHICPTNANFQFDTAFMFIIAGLILTKVFQNRHPDIHANAFIAFFSFAVVIFFTLLGINYDRSNPVAVRCSLLLVVMTMVAGFFTSFYYFHRWKLSREMFNKVFKSWKFFSLRCLHPARFWKLFIAFVINITISDSKQGVVGEKKTATVSDTTRYYYYVGLIVIPSSYTDIAIVAIFGYSFLDFATTVLAFFLTNVLIFIALYVCAKLYYREPWTLLPMFLPILMCGLWTAALYFFQNSVTDWQLTPAESRHFNRPCITMGFYDDHDVWHFLSATALFFSFLFIMTLDDGISDRPWDDIQIF